MAVNSDIIINTLIGGFLSFLASVAVAYIYVNNQNSIEQNKRINEQIQKTYFEKGILPLQEAIQEYAEASIFVFHDLSKKVGIINKYKMDLESLEDVCEEIKSRSIVKSLIQKQFTSATDSFPYIGRFGIQLYGVTIRILQHWSTLIEDSLNYEHLIRQIKEAGLVEIRSGLEGTGSMIQSTQLYLLKRLNNLQDYIWEKQYYSYNDFIEILKTKEYKNFLDDLDQYNKIYTKVMDSMMGVLGSESVEKITKEFSVFSKELVDDPFKKDVSDK